MSAEAKDRLLLVLLAGGFAMLFFDVRYEHRYMLLSGGNIVPWIPVIASGVLVFACFLAMGKTVQMKTVAGTLFVLGALVGVLGVFQHTEGEMQKLTDVITQKMSRDKDDHAPMIAPLSFTGLSSIGAVLVFAKPRRSSSKA